MSANAEFKKYSEECFEETKELLKAIAVIPAPSHHEERRAEFILEWMKNNGGENAFIDEALNVVWEYNVREDNELLVFMAHTDIVFPEETPLAVKEENGRFYCPGIGDDTGKLTPMLMAARYIVQNNIKSDYGVVFVANSCEEGLGNLKGSRKIVDTYGNRIKNFVTFDSKLGIVCMRAVGSHRYRVTVNTEGGHSWGAFGNRNAIRVMSSIIDTLYSVKVPQVNDSRTTYNVGGIKGGTSVNTIAQSCEMLYEYRSNDRECLDIMREMFFKVIDAYRATGVEIKVELLGERPCGGEIDKAAHKELIDTASECFEKLGYSVRLGSGSTDANVPLSRGIPAICVGNAISEGSHTLGEWLEIESLKDGVAFSLELMNALINK